MSKYYSKETVIAKFKLDVLTDLPDAASDEAKKTLWESFLAALMKLGKISRHQAKSWVYPKNEL